MQYSVTLHIESSLCDITSHYNVMANNENDAIKAAKQAAQNFLGESVQIYTIDVLDVYQLQPDESERLH